MKTKMNLLFSLMLITAFVLAACGGASATPAPVATEELPFVESSANGTCGKYNYTMHSDGNILITSKVSCVDDTIAWFIIGTEGYAVVDIYVGHAQDGNLGADVEVDSFPDGASCAGNALKAECTYEIKNGPTIRFDLTATDVSTTVAPIATEEPATQADTQVALASVPANNCPFNTEQNSNWGPSFEFPNGHSGSYGSYANGTKTFAICEWAELEYADGMTVRVYWDGSNYWVQKDLPLPLGCGINTEQNTNWGNSFEFPSGERGDHGTYANGTKELAVCEWVDLKYAGEETVRVYWNGFDYWIYKYLPNPPSCGINTIENHKSGTSFEFPSGERGDHGTYANGTKELAVCEWVDLNWGDGKSVRVFWNGFDYWISDPR